MSGCFVVGGGDGVEESTCEGMNYCRMYGVTEKKTVYFMAIYFVYLITCCLVLFF